MTPFSGLGYLHDTVGLVPYPFLLQRMDLIGYFKCCSPAEGLAEFVLMYGAHSITSRITDRRRERALAANPAYEEPGASKLQRGAAVRVQPLVRIYTTQNAASTDGSGSGWPISRNPSR